MGKNITLKQIAQELDISIGTVSRALHGKEDINPDTKQRIMDKIKEMNYVPNKYARSLSVKNRLKVAVIMLYNADFWYKVKAGIELAEKQMSQYGIDVDYICLDRLDSDSILSHLESLYKNNCKGVILVPMGIEDINVPLNGYIQKGMPVVLLNDDIPESLRQLYIGPDNEQIGRLAGELAGKMSGGNGRCLVVSNQDMDSDRLPVECRARLRGFHEVVKAEYPGMVSQLCTYSIYGSAYESTLQQLTKDPDINSVYSMDGFAEDIGLAVKDSGRTDLVVIGHEMSDPVHALLEDGTISAIICQNPELQGYYALKYMVDHLIDKRLPAQDRIFIKFNLYTKYNCYDAVGYVGDMGLMD